VTKPTCASVTRRPRLGANWVIHDLRRTAWSLMSRAGVASDHAARCLGHIIGGVRGVCDRHDFQPGARPSRRRSSASRTRPTTWCLSAVRRQAETSWGSEGSAWPRGLLLKAPLRGTGGGVSSTPAPTSILFCSPFMRRLEKLLMPSNGVEKISIELIPHIADGPRAAETGDSFTPVSRLTCLNGMSLWGHVSPPALQKSCCRRRAWPAIPRSCRAVSRACEASTTDTSSAERSVRRSRRLRRRSSTS
jgi:hypothetical protein